MGKFEDEVIGVQRVEELEKGLPLPGLDRLAAIVPEAEVHRGGTIKGVEDPVNCFRREGAVGGIAGDVGLVDLQARARAVRHLDR